MRIAHVNLETGWGGGEVQTLLLARGLAQAGHECVLFLHPDGRLRRAAASAGLEVRPLPTGRFPQPATFFQLGSDVFRGEFDVCHSHDGKAVALSAFAGSGTGRVARIATRRLSRPLGGNWFGWTGPWSVLDHVIAVSRLVRSRLVEGGVPPPRISVVPSAVDLDRFTCLPPRSCFRAEIGVHDGEFLVGSISRLAPRKGLDRLLEAAAGLWRRHRHVRFVIVGDGECERILADRIRSRGLEGAFHLVGFREDIPAVLAGLDCLVFPAAEGEGSPGVIKEAMAAGVPVVAVDHPAVREIARPGRSAILVSAGAIGGMVAAVERLILEPRLARKLAREGLREAGRFSASRMVSGTEAVYWRVLDER